MSLLKKEEKDMLNNHDTIKTNVFEVIEEILAHEKYHHKCYSCNRYLYVNNRRLTMKYIQSKSEDFSFSTK